MTNGRGLVNENLPVSLREVIRRIGTDATAGFRPLDVASRDSDGLGKCDQLSLTMPIPAPEGGGIGPRKTHGRADAGWPGRV